MGRPCDVGQLTEDETVSHAMDLMEQLTEEKFDDVLLTILDTPTARERVMYMLQFEIERGKEAQ